MKYRIEITQHAEQEIESQYRYIAQQAPVAAKRWKQGIRAGIRSLADQPQRHGLSPESGAFSYDVRQLLYGRRRNYRVLFTVASDFVVVLAVRHAAQDAFDPDDL